MSEIPIKLIRKIEGIFQQGDHRYNYPEGVMFFAAFVQNKAIEIEKR